MDDWLDAVSLVRYHGSDSVTDLHIRALVLDVISQLEGVVVAQAEAARWEVVDEGDAAEWLLLGRASRVLLELEELLESDMGPSSGGG